MDDQDRLDLILTQAAIAKAAMASEPGLTAAEIEQNLQQAVLAVEAIVLLADPDFHIHSTAA